MKYTQLFLLIKFLESTYRGWVCTFKNQWEKVQSWGWSWNLKIGSSKEKSLYKRNRNETKRAQIRKSVTERFTIRS